MRRLPIVLAVAGIAAIGAAGGRDPDPNFSQYPGFATYYAAHPPATTVPATADQDLAQRFRPRLCLPADHHGPIDFYADYIAHGVLHDRNGDPISDRVDGRLLNRHKHDPAVMFVHHPTDAAPTPVIYARVDRASARLPTGETRFVFITYTAVFRHSGLPAGLPAWQRTVLDLIASTGDWHQLDHYTAATVILDSDLTPVAVMFQHHNHQQTHLVGVDIDWPANDRLTLDVAIGSNELYPHRPGRTHRRSVGFPDQAGLRYLISGEDPPFLAADDITDCADLIDPPLRFLPPDDAFYRFAGYLGEGRLLPGRDGPPGADYNTLPALKPLARQMLVSYWRADHPGDLTRLDQAFAAAPNPTAALLAFAEAQAEVFHRDWQCHSAPSPACE